MSTLTDTIGLSADRAVRIENLRKSYRDGKDRRTALDELALEIKPGEWTALLGPVGCGKSSLLRICSTLETPDFGLVEVAGHNAATHPDLVRSRIGVVFETPSLDGLLSVGDNLLLQGSLFHLPKSGSVMRAKALADQFGLTTMLKERVDTLSDSMKRCVDLARALMSEPSLLVLDEPTHGLSREGRMAYLDMLDAIRADRSELAIIMSTHQLDEAERADTVALMNRGTVVTSGPPEALRAKLTAQVVVTAPEFAGVLREAGLNASATATEATGVGHESHVRAACESLLERGAKFSVGPATMNDLFQPSANDASDSTPTAIDPGVESNIESSVEEAA